MGRVEDPFEIPVCLSCGVNQKLYGASDDLRQRLDQAAEALAYLHGEKVAHGDVYGDWE